MATLISFKYLKNHFFKSLSGVIPITDQSLKTGFSPIFSPMYSKQFIIILFSLSLRILVAVGYSIAKNRPLAFEIIPIG